LSAPDTVSACLEHENKAGNKSNARRFSKLKELFMANGFKGLINANLRFYLSKLWIRYLVEGLIKKMDFKNFTRVPGFGVFFLH